MLILVIVGVVVERRREQVRVMPYPIGTEQVPHAVIGDDTFSSSSQSAMLNGQPDPSGLPKTVSGNGRLHAIMTNDVHALVKSIKDIEFEISEYERENKIPAWADALISRLNTIDLRKKQLDDDIRILDLGIIDETKSYGDRAMGKFKHELTSQINLTKYNLETRIANTTCEIDRLQKLLQIRPTKSEMQTMNSIVADASQSVQHSFTTVKRDIRQLISLKATDELNEVLKQLNYNDTMGNKVSIDLNNKVESFVREMHRMRNGIHNIVDQMSLKVDEVETKTKNLHLNNEHNIALYEKEHSKCKLEIGEFRTELNESQASFEEFKASTNSNLAQIKIDAYSHEANNTTIRLQRDTNLNRHKSENSEFRVYMGDFTDNVKHSIKDARFDVELMKRNYFDFDAHQKDLIGNLTPFQKSDIDGIFTRTRNKIDQIVTAIDTSEESANSSEVKSLKVERLLNLISIDGELLPAMCSSLLERVDSVVGESGNTKNDISTLTKEMRILHDQLDKLLLIEREMKEDRTKIEKLEIATDTYKGKLVILKDAFTRNKCDLDKSLSDIEKFNEIIALNADDLTSEMSLRMDEKQEQILEQVRDIEENIQIMEKQKELMSTSKNEVSISSQLLKSKKLKKLKKSSTHGDDVDENSLTSSQLTTIFIEEKIKDDSEEIPLSAIGLTEREQREIVDIQTLFMSKACITFEIKCVREKYVSDVPKGTIRHIINCSQRLAAFLSTCVDSETIQKVLKPNLGLGESNYMTEDAALQRRTETIEEFLKDVRAIVESNSYNIGSVRNAAREKFFNQLRLALNLFMSKHSQVIVLGTSLFGRLKYPTSSNCYVVEQRPPVMIKLDPHFIQGKLDNNDMTDDFEENKDTDQLGNGPNFTNSIPSPLLDAIDLNRDLGYYDVSTVPDLSIINGPTVTDSILEEDIQSYHNSGAKYKGITLNQRPTGKQSTRKTSPLKLPIISNVPLDDPMRYNGRLLQNSHSAEVLRGAKIPIAYEMKMNRSASIDDFSPNPYVPPSFIKKVKDDNTASFDVIQMLGYDVDQRN